jgi:hypothetical protein
MSDAPGRALVPGCADGVNTAAADSHPFEVSVEQSAVATAESTGDRTSQPEDGSRRPRSDRGMTVRPVLSARVGAATC